MGLKAMGIADSIVNLAFGLTLGAVAVAFALSFGLGGQEAAARFLRKMQDKMDRERDEAKAKSALTPNSSTQDKVAASVRENTPNAASNTTPASTVSTTPVAPAATSTPNNLSSNTATPSNLGTSNDLDSRSDLGSEPVDINHIETDDSNINNNGFPPTNDNDNLK